jgi:hypothetical protein
VYARRGLSEPDATGRAERGAGSHGLRHRTGSDTTELSQALFSDSASTLRQWTDGFLPFAPTVRPYPERLQHCAARRAIRRMVEPEIRPRCY